MRRVLEKLSWALTIAVLPVLPPDGAAADEAESAAPCHVRGIRDRANCLTLHVPERRDRTGSERTIPVHIAVLPAAGAAAEPDPLFVLAGGPGQAAGELGRSLEAVFDKVRRKRELVLMDQRGTGRSAPLRCPLPAGVASSGAKWRPAQTCLEKLKADVRGYDSAAFVRDLEAARQALGYEKINIWAVSYGTRAALLYARAYPGRVRTMVLDGVLPPDRNLFEAEPLSSEAALERTLTACEEDSACASAFPELRRSLDKALTRLEDGPQQLPDPQAEGAPVRIGRQDFMQNLRGALYRPLSAAAVPFIIDRFVAGDARPLFAYAYEINRRMVDRMYLGLTLSVLCTEELPRADPRKVAAAAAESRFGTAYYDFWKQACEDWPRAAVPPAYGTPVRAEMPVLLLSGALDPVTPPAAAEQAARTLSRSTHFVAPAAGHNVSGFGCAPDLIADFIAAADASGLDPSCLAEQGRPPFLLGRGGPRP
ncbi:MAG: alpha/beta fold hydrolase [Alphaproteobacteria bacterium]